jgi:hypothetical protein
MADRNSEVLKARERSLCNPSMRCSPNTYVLTPARSRGDVDCFERQNWPASCCLREYNRTTEQVMRKIDVTNLSADITRLRNLGITDFMLSVACDYIGAGDRQRVALDKVLNGRAVTDDERAFVLDQLSDYAEFFR